MSYQIERDLGTTPDGKSTTLLYHNNGTKEPGIFNIRASPITSSIGRQYFVPDIGTIIHNATAQTDARILNLTLNKSIELPYEIQIIQNASQKEIEKATITNMLEFNETREIYDKVTMEVREKSQKREAWIDEIIRGEKEQEKVIYKNNDLVVVKDSKWRTYDDDKEMHYLMLFADENLTCIRDLKGQHIGMLQHGMDEALQKIEEKHGMTRERLRIYFHYHPNYYRLHVHIVAHSSSSLVMNNSIGFEQVVQNLAIDPAWYQTYSILVKVSEHSAWHKKYLEFMQERSMDLTMAAL